MERFLHGNEMGLEIGQILSERGLSMSTAESCTGGTIASMVTAIAGSSAYFKGGVVSYAVSVKEQVLGVTLRDGVVSEDTALQMARGAIRVCGSDCAVATTGVAGPGPSDGHPQGTVCMAAVIQCENCDNIGNPETLELSRTFNFVGDRETVILQAADVALRLLKELIATVEEKNR